MRLFVLPRRKSYRRIGLRLTKIAPYDTIKDIERLSLRPEKR